MDKKKSIYVFFIIFFMGTTLYFGINSIRYKDHNIYYRSKMFEYQLLSSLYKIFPIGSSLDKTLLKLKLDKSAIIKSPKDDSMIVDILPELPIAKSEQKDYHGFYFKFIDQKLVSITPVGPDIAKNSIVLSELDFGKEIQYYQEP